MYDKKPTGPLPPAPKGAQEKFSDLDNMDAAVAAREKFRMTFNRPGRVLVTPIGQEGARRTPVADTMVYNTGPFFAISSKEAQLVMQAATAWAIKRSGQKPNGKQLVVAIQTMIYETATKRRISLDKVKALSARIRSGMTKKAYAGTSPEAKKSYSAQFKKTMGRVKAEPALRARFIKFAKMKDHPKGLHKVAQRVLTAAGIKY